MDLVNFYVQAFTYSRSDENVNNRFFYRSDFQAGKAGIWQCQYENTDIVQWQIGFAEDRHDRACIGFATNFQDAVCPQSLTGYSWWMHGAEYVPKWTKALKGLAIRCVSDDDQKSTNGPENFV